ncbi:hypothetical protein ALP68_100713 [Pseudomonas ficuserectae]|nr:hypothetical protein ALP68_100713 [Pseudomonas ficuserectae]RMS39267.1 hypothetical protein ALP67_100640 [Pseudomonas ficuserectae]
MIICLILQLKRSPAIRAHLPAGWSEQYLCDQPGGLRQGLDENASIYRGCVTMSHHLFYI